MATINQKTYFLKDNREIIIRSAVKEDANGILESMRLVMEEEIYQLTSSLEFKKTIADEEKWIQSHLDHPLHLIQIAILDQKVIGLIDFSNGHRHRIAHTGEFGMSVDKNVRGLGVGSILLQSLIDWAKSTQQIEKINLSVHANNDRAIGLYKKLGFIVEGTRKKDLKYGPNEYIDTVLMGKLI